MTSGEERSGRRGREVVFQPRRSPADQLALLGAEEHEPSMLHEIELDTADDLADT
jgi:hypothetical protein